MVKLGAYLMWIMFSWCLIFSKLTQRKSIRSKSVRSQFLVLMSKYREGDGEKIGFFKSIYWLLRDASTEIAWKRFSFFAPKRGILKMFWQQLISPPSTSHLFSYMYWMQAPKKKPPKKFSVFDTSSAGPLRIMLYISLGVLGAMLLAGFTWDLLCHKRRQHTISGMVALATLHW